MRALDLITIIATAPGAGAIGTAVAGDSLVIRGANPQSRVLVVGVWSKKQAVGVTQITRPYGHDTTRGIRYREIAGNPTPRVGRFVPFTVQPQEPLTCTIIGSATAGDVEYVSVQLWYEDLPGVDARLIDVDTLRQKCVNILTVEDTLTATATGYSGPRLINAGSDLLKPNTDYAVIGASIGIVCQAVTLRGSDFGNLRIAIPGTVDPDIAPEYFVNLSMAVGVPLIPVFNSGSRGGIIAEVVQDENNTAVPVAWHLAELTR